MDTLLWLAIGGGVLWYISTLAASTPTASAGPSTSTSTSVTSSSPVATMTPVAPNAATVVAAVPVVSYVPPSVTMSGNENTTMPVAVMPVAQMPTVAPAVSSNLNALTALMQNNGLDPTASYPVTTFLIFYSQIVGSGNAPNTADLGFGNNDVVTLTQFWNALSGYTNGLSGMGRMKAWKL